MKKWQVQIIGHPYDLEDIFENQKSQSWSIVREGDQYFFESVLFHELEDADTVREVALKILELVNGSAKLRISGFRPVEMGNISRIDDAGRRHHFVLLQGSLGARSRLRAAAVVVKSDGSVKEEEIEKPDRIESTFTLADSNENVADALRLYGRHGMSWIDLYKIYEIIRDDVGGTNELLDREYVLKKDIRRFTHTAQHPGAIGDEARHARITADIPKDPMSLSEANLLISTLLNKWVDSKLHN